jgi:xylem cysteine proteinase
MRNSFWLSFFIALFISAVIVSNFDKEEFMNKMQMSGLLGPQVEITEAEFQEAFINFISVYQKSYLNSYEFETKYETFKSNFQSIVDHNERKEELGFELAVNAFGDMSQTEFKEKYLGLNAPKKTFADFLKDPKPQRKSAKPTHGRHHSRSDIPKSVDWFEQGMVQKVKNQGSCGSCWAFSAIGAIESAIAIKDGKLPNLSEQQLVDCSTSFGNEGCNGGLMDFAFEYAETTPLCTEADYAYKGRDQTCKLDDKEVTCSETYNVKDYYDVTPQSSDSLHESLAQGPVSIGVCAEGLAWQFYFRGVVSALCGQCLDHGVLAVGYGNGGLWKNVDNIKIKNSWGTGWGESGFIRVQSDIHETGKGTCGIYEAPSVPIV